MVTIILVCTGNKFDEWYVDNILYMICEYGKLEYNKVHIIRDGEGSYYDKLKMFKECTDDVQYLYFDLDIIVFCMLLMPRVEKPAEDIGNAPAIRLYYFSLFH